MLTVKGMFKPNSSLTTRLGSFFSWKSDGLIVAMMGGNALGAKGVTKFGPQPLNFTEDHEP